MKLYYDMLVPYMPDSIKSESGELVRDDRKAAGRIAMSELANFQQNGNLMSLYNSVLQACLYANVDLVDTIINMPESITIPDGIPVLYLLDDAAKSLFMSIKTDSFDVNQYVAYLLTAAHYIVQKSQETANAKSDATDESSDSGDA